MIQYYNRKTGKYEIEKVAGEKYLEWTYASPVGRGLLELLIKKKLFSKLYGAYCDTGRSASKIKSFVEAFEIPMEQSVKKAYEFRSFNDFFTRELKPEARTVDPGVEVIASPGDGRLTAYENIDIDQLVQVKGMDYRLAELIGNESIAKTYQGGVCLILRLCPTDYHRFHFIDSGICGKTVTIPGDYYSVNPIALARIPNLFCRNKREYSLFHSDHFGIVLMMEVGATCVGSIIQTYKPGDPVNKGQEKGYFKFGGSTIVLFFEQNRIQMDLDLLRESSNGHETKVIMGEKIGVQKG